MYQVKELREKRAKLHEDAKSILKAAVDEKRDSTPEERAKVDKIYADVDALKADIDRLEKAEAEERALAESAGRKTETFVSDARPSSDMALRAWVMGERATEEQRAAAAFYGINPRSKEFDLRALTIGTTTAGGNSVPNEMMRAFLEVQKWYGRVENLATVINTETGATLPWPTVDDTSNTGRLLTEGTGATTTTDPSFGVVNLSSYKMSSDAVIVSMELLQDSSINLAQYLGSALGTRIGRIKNTYFTTGSGSSQPGGVQVKASLGKTASATNAITLDEIIDLYHAVDIAYRSDPSFAFMMNDTVAAYVRKLKDSNNQYLWQMAVQAGQPDRLFGVPVIINNDQDGTFATNKRLVLAGAFSKYVVRIAGGVTIARSDDLYFLNHQSVFLGVQRVDGNLVDTTAVKYLRTA
jgi:HK97 family phage major capsid protein